MPDDQPVASFTPIVAPDSAAEDMRWLPQPGPELSALLAHKLEGRAQAQAQVAIAARRILGRGVPPGQTGSDTGLVVGYVQSGKTLSFTAVTALARDNGFQLVVVIAGSSTQLSDQSYKRVRKDLRADGEDRRRWALYLNPGTAQAAGIEGLLDEWRDRYVGPEQRKTVVLTVMKQHTHLRNLTRLLRGLDLAGVSALVIDDEGDQASLNTQAQQGARLRQQKESTIYRRLMELRGALPSHTFLQYTATPQAPLLISIIDSLSARWVEVLEPGDGYTGGVTFFGPPRDRTISRDAAQNTPLVSIIPASDVPSATNQVQSAPASLKFALQLFMTGVASAYARSEAFGNRSMLVHPSVRTADHQKYLVWISDLFHDWRATFRRGENDPDARTLADTFRRAYDDLAATVGARMPSFEDVRARLRTAFNNTDMREVNRRQGGPPVIIDWSQQYGWILVGAKAMDRGFTVEGLTVTYMPRDLGGGNADSMQQRARFFGYKAGYLGYCRVFLEWGVKQAFEDYVEHEEFMRRDLKTVAEEHRPLETWPRRFVLDPLLKPCRDNVLRDPYARSVALAGEWFTPQAFMGGAGTEEHNRRVVTSFIGGQAFRSDPGNADRTDTQRHDITDLLPLREVVAQLLADYRMRDPVEVEKWTGLMAQLGAMLDKEDEVQAVVYRMSPARMRSRGIYATGRVKQFFQGEYPVTPVEQRGRVYPGDRAIFCEGAVTVQLHVLDLTNDAGQVVAAEVPFLAVRLPAGAALPTVTQVQPGQPVFGDTDSG